MIHELRLSPAAFMRPVHQGSPVAIGRDTRRAVLTLEPKSGSL